jgi:hypothetical protein
VLIAKNLDWQFSDDGKSHVDLWLVAASLSRRRDFLASRLQNFRAIASNQDAARLDATVTHLPVTIRTPRKMQTLRVVVQTIGNGRTGTAELDRKMIDQAPQAPTPEPQLIPQPQKPPAPPTPAQP